MVFELPDDGRIFKFYCNQYERSKLSLECYKIPSYPVWFGFVLVLSDLTLVVEKYAVWVNHPISNSLLCSLDSPIMCRHHKKVPSSLHYQWKLYILSILNSSIPKELSGSWNCIRELMSCCSNLRACKALKMVFFDTRVLMSNPKPVLRKA